MLTSTIEKLFSVNIKVDISRESCFYFKTAFTHIILRIRFKWCICYRHDTAVFFRNIATTELFKTDHFQCSNPFKIRGAIPEFLLNRNLSNAMSSLNTFLKKMPMNLFVFNAPFHLF